MLVSEDQIFTSTELEVNQRNRLALFDLIKSKDSMLMAGAGCTASIYPDWKGFIDNLTSAAQELDQGFLPINSLNEDFLAFASRVKKCIGESKYYFLLYRQFEPGVPTHLPYHESLCRLPFRGITTTNYDVVLEHALAKIINGNLINFSIWIEDGVEEAEIFEFLLSLNQSKTEKKVFHIHGIYNRKNSIILCDHEYKDKYGFTHKPIGNSKSLYQNVKDGLLSEDQFKNLLVDHGMVWTPLRKILWSLFATRRLVFIGFSMNDPYFIKMLEFVSTDLHTYNSAAHYIVFRITKTDKERIMGFAGMLKKKYGIQAVFFEDDENYKGLERFIYEMSEDINAKPAEKLEKQEPVNVLALGDESLTEDLIRISREKNGHED